MANNEQLEGIKLIAPLVPAEGMTDPLINSKNVGFASSLEGFEDITNLESAVEYIYNIVKAAPELSYSSEIGFRENDKKTWRLGEEMYILFNLTSSATGKSTITILRNGLPFRTVQVNNGLVSIPLGRAEIAADYKYSVTAVDSLGKPAIEQLVFHHILGGVTLTSTFSDILKETVYTANIRNTIKIPFSISYAQLDLERELRIQLFFPDGTIETYYKENSGYERCGTSNISDEREWNIELKNAGFYRLTIDARVNDNGNYLESETLSYEFVALNADSIAVSFSSGDLTNLNTDSVVSLSFRPVTNIESIKNSLYANCNLISLTVDEETGLPTGEEKIIKTTTINDLKSGQIFTWIIGRISNPGLYKYRVSCLSTGVTNIESVEGTFSVAQGTQIGSNYETDNLIAYFSAEDMDNNDANPSKWLSHENIGKNPQSSYYYFKLNGLNYSNNSYGNGWVYDSDMSKMLKFTGESFGELRYVNSDGIDSRFCPMSLVTEAKQGNSFEILFKTRCIGELDSKVVSACNEKVTNYGGYSIGYDKAKLSSTSSTTSITLNEDEWIHLVFVIDKNIITLGENDSSTTVSTANIENMNPVKSLKIYVNGVLTSYAALPKEVFFFNGVNYPYPLTLNAFLNPVESGNLEEMIASGFGSCEIKLIRFYDKALNSSQVLGNYISSFFDPNEKQKLQNRNNPSKADIPVIHFIKNKNIKGTPPKGARTFADMHKVTVKKSDKEGIHTSKNSWVNCTMWYKYLNEDGSENITSFDDVDVYLQGTSSLQYPVKNYQIKVYKDSNGERKKNKILPPNKGVKDGWLVPDSTYTLKCDYMEHSHKNNTPTAILYESISDTVVRNINHIMGINSTDLDFSPARSIKSEYTYEDSSGETVTEEKEVYRDSINGFPCLVYYNDNDDPSVDYNVSSQSYADAPSTLAGTFMFNIDKEGKALGFEIDCEETDLTMDIYEDGEIVGNEVIHDSNGEALKRTILPCVSLEGSSNSDTGAAAFQTMDDYHKTIYKTEYLEKWYLANKDLIVGTRVEIETTIVDEDGEEKEIVTETVINITLGEQWSYDEFSEKVQEEAGKITDLNGDRLKDSSGNEITLSTLEEFILEKGFASEYDYIAATLEPRFTYADEYEDIIDEDTWNHLTYDRMLNTINWVSENWQDKTVFVNEFENHFSLAYCMVYYLQMMMFTQVDNAGKNAMFDSWGGKFYPRPYDMDTQMGENNTGQDVIIPSAEINSILSPAGITGSSSGLVVVSNSETDSSHPRYSTYNTRLSKLWTAFGTHFRSQIQAVYSVLRDSEVYSVENIVKTVERYTSEIIGETFYNKDAGAKYLSQTAYDDEKGTIISEQLPKLQGNRSSRYREFLTKRTIFLDSFFNYIGNNTTYKEISLRSNSYNLGSSTATIGISVYSPQYVTIQIGTDVTVTTFIDENSSYMYNGEQYEGVMFTLPFIAIDKDATIHGAANIKTINHMENLVLSSITLGNAKKLLNLSIPNSQSLVNLDTGGNSYLRTVNVANSSKLGTGNTVELNLESCVNLQSVVVDNTQLTSVRLPIGGSLKKFSAKNCNITSVNFSNLQFLTEIDISGCDSISSYTIEKCPLIESLSFKEFPSITKVSVNGCDSISNLDLSSTFLTELDIGDNNNLIEINLSSCKGKVLNDLNLTKVYSLEILKLGNSENKTLDEYIDLQLPLYKKEYSQLSQEEIDKLISDGIDVYWHNLRELHSTYTKLRNLKSGSEFVLLA